MSLALLVFKLQLTSHPDGGHFGFCQYGGPMRRPSWRPSKSKQYDVWCFWKNLSQNVPNTPDYNAFYKFKYITQ